MLTESTVIGRLKVLVERTYKKTTKQTNKQKTTPPPTTTTTKNNNITYRNTTHHNTTQRNKTQQNTTQHNATQHDTTQHNTTKHNARQHNATQHNATQHNTTQHNTTQRNTTYHNAPHHTKPHHNATQQWVLAALNTLTQYPLTILFCCGGFHEISIARDDVASTVRFTGLPSSATEAYNRNYMSLKILLRSLRLTGMHCYRTRLSLRCPIRTLWTIEDRAHPNF